MDKAQKMFGRHQISREKLLSFRFGHLNIWFRQSDDELWVSHSHSVQQLEQFPENPNWQRWSINKASTEIQLSPSFPALPLVIRSEHPFKIQAGINTRLFVRLPLWMNIRVNEKTVLEVPSRVLSKTWFGTFLDGEICFSMTSSARKKPVFEAEHPYLIVSPIHIYNRSEEELLVDKFCHRVGRLNLYQNGNHYWTNETRVYFQGNNEISDIDYGEKPPAESDHAKLVAPAREEYRKGLTGRTFDTLKDLAKLDFLHR